MIYVDEIKQAAKRLYLNGAKPQEIAKELNVKSVRTIYNWIEKGGWNDLSCDPEELAISRRFNLLVEKENKTELDLKEMDVLTDQMYKLAKVERYKKATSEGVLNVGRSGGENSGGSDGKGNGNNKGKKKKTVKNDVSGITIEDFKECFHDKMWGHQKHLYKVKHDKALCRTRNVLKTRQGGLTYYFAAEAFEDAILTGDNQIFLSASRGQSAIFLAYIRAFARDWFGIELKGNPAVLSNGAELHCLSTNSRTAQGFSGHVYRDEYFWTPNFEKLNSVTSAIATHKKWRRTYFSTPSTLDHEAYPFWSGDKFNKKRKNKVEFPSFDELREGRLCPDGQYRYIITIEDAIKGGCKEFDLEQLKLEFPGDEFDNLFLCKFIDDKRSVFTHSALSKGICDASLWDDFTPKSDRPFGNTPVWIGFDPSRTRDNSTIVVIAPPLKPGGKFRVLEKLSWRGRNIQYQAKRMKELTEKYNVQYIGIDVTGMGLGVHDLVKDFYPRVTAIHYNIDNKTQMVVKALDIVANDRLRWDAEHKDISQSFLMIKQCATPGGLITYSANRTESEGHADVAWAIMHVLINEPLNYKTQRKSSMAMSGT